MNKLWSDRAWNDYLYWQTQDKKTLKKINELVKDIERSGAGDRETGASALSEGMEPENRL